MSGYFWLWGPNKSQIISKIATQGNLEENDTNLLARDHLTVYAGFNCLIMIKLIRYYLCKLKLKVRGLEYHVFQV